jgi:ribosome-associated protein
MNDTTEISKTKRKEQMNDLQDLGIELVKLSKDKLKQIDIPEYLLDAVKEAQKLTAHGAIKRQHQYIGKLMRKEIDAESLRRRLDYLNGDSILYTQIFHLSETWRDKLLADEQLLTEFVELYAQTDVTELRALIRMVKKEQELGQNKNFTQLFRLIKSFIEKEML